MQEVQKSAPPVDSIISQEQALNGRSTPHITTPARGARPPTRRYGFGVSHPPAPPPPPPPAAAGARHASRAQVPPPAFSRSGAVGAASPADGCSAIGAAVSGKIALIDRGNCTFKTKVANAQAAGAIAVVIGNNVTSAPLAMADDPTITTPITIPSVMI